MLQNIRHHEILEIARRDGKVLVETLAVHFDVTLQTIRRDLTELAEAGCLERVHGGAILPSGTNNIGYEDRRALNSAAKAAIATACAQEIPANSSVFINLGTSTEAVAHALKNHKNLMVVTNNMNVAWILADNPECEIVVTGGTLRRSDGGLIGPVASNAIHQFKFDFAVVGCSAIDEDGDILDFDLQEVGVSQAILKNARRSFLVADSSKFHRSAPARIAPLSAIDTLFTNDNLSPDLIERCRQWDTNVQISHAALDRDGISGIA